MYGLHPYQISMVHQMILP